MYLTKGFGLTLNRSLVVLVGVTHCFNFRHLNMLVLNEQNQEMYDLIINLFQRYFDCLSYDEKGQIVPLVPCNLDDLIVYLHGKKAYYSKIIKILLILIDQQSSKAQTYQKQENEELINHIRERF